MINLGYSNFRKNGIQIFPATLGTINIFKDLLSNKGLLICLFFSLITINSRLTSIVEILNEFVHEILDKVRFVSGQIHHLPATLTFSEFRPKDLGH